MRSHGGGRACYKLKTYPACDPCRETNARQHTSHNRSQSHRDADARYESTALGMLKRVRSNAKVRKT